MNTHLPLAHLWTSDLEASVAWFQAEGFRIHRVFPADNPRVISLVGHGLELELRREGAVEPAVDGFEAQTVVCQGGVWGTGRAGMQYRDLLPGRWGGRYIASHIRIAQGGPVPDWVHHHQVGWQLIFVHRGWVRVVYEDQGEPFVMRAGDCVLQPPTIRHQVLESGDDLEVVELGSPAEHDTLADPALALPNADVMGRDWAGQAFVWSQAATRSKGEELGLHQATGGLVAVHEGPAASLELGPQDADWRFVFVRSGPVVVTVAGVAHSLETGDAISVAAGAAGSLGGSGRALLAIVPSVRRT